MNLFLKIFFEVFKGEKNSFLKKKKNGKTRFLNILEKKNIKNFIKIHVLHIYIIYQLLIFPGHVYS